jgi:hypothetical protein
MAKIKFGAVITDSRGHIGGITYAWTRFGNVARRLVTPTRRQTPASQESRSRFMTLSKRWWSTLSPTERDDWRALAAANPRPNLWGDEYPLTGHQLFIGINSLLDQAGYPIVDTAPADQVVTGLSSLTITAAAPDELELTFTPSPLPADHLLYIFGRANYSPGIGFVPSSLKFVEATAEEEVSPLEIGTEFSDELGPIVTGRQQMILGQLLNVTNGAVSVAIPAAAIAT